jgi:hypothetical protein
MVSSGFNENRGWWVLRLGHAREPCRVQYNSQDFAEAARNSSFKNCCSFCTLTPIILSNNYVARITFFYVLQRHQILIQLVTTNLFQIFSNVIQSLISCFLSLGLSSNSFLCFYVTVLSYLVQFQFVAL